jgi:hypothetical protein
MSRVTTGALAAHIAVLIACGACLVCAYAIPAASAIAATSAGSVTTESEQALKRQIAADEISSASFRIKEHALRLVLKDGQHVSVHLSGPPSAKLRAELDKSGAKVSKKSPPHKLRYVVLGIVVVVLILIAGALVLWRRRRHAALDEY